MLLAILKKATADFFFFSSPSPSRLLSRATSTQRLGEDPLEFALSLPEIRGTQRLCEQARNRDPLDPLEGVVTMGNRQQL
ncbi:unnamed protein product [Boreogadus saida]